MNRKFLVILITLPIILISALLIYFFLGSNDYNSRCPNINVKPTTRELAEEFTKKPDPNLIEYSSDKYKIPDFSKAEIKDIIVDPRGFGTECSSNTNPENEIISIDFKYKLPEDKTYRKGLFVVGTRYFRLFPETRSITYVSFEEKE